jgi:hypothetical protein
MKNYSHLNAVIAFTIFRLHVADCVMLISQADLCKHLSDRILWRLATMQDDEKVPMFPFQYHEIPLEVPQRCEM